MTGVAHETIEQVLRKHAPSTTDDAVLNYLTQLLEDSDAYKADQESLVETVSHFLDGDTDAAIAIVSCLTKKCLLPEGEGGASSAKRGEEKVNASADSADDARLLPSEQIPKPPTQLLEQQQSTSDSDLSPAKQNVEPSSTTDNLPKEQAGAGGPKRRKERRKRSEKQQHKRNVAHQEATLEDDASAWKECQETEQLWGGRGKGGRGAYAGRTNSVNSNIHLTSVSIALDNGLELLQDSTMDIVKGHRYGLIGRNGVGKSTLLHRLAARAIPGMPHYMRVLLVEQQQDIPNHCDQSALEMLIESDVYRTMLLEEQDEIETAMEDDPTGVSEEEMVELAERLGLVVAELDAIQADTAEERALSILKGLQFTNSMIHGPASNLSGGWRMRLALARALLRNDDDILLLDEITNHLDLYGLEWVIEYLKNSNKTLIVVSHDRVFLDAVCTDIIVLEHQRLSYYVGNYSLYEQQMQEKAARESQILDAAERQRTKAQVFVQKQQSAANKKSADPNKQRQAKMIREKKMDRIGNYREDGKRYKQFSLKALDEKEIRLAQKVNITSEEPVIKLLFPNPTWPPAVGPNETIVRMENLSFGYGEDKLILKDITLHLDRGSKIALVGRNGSGKSTLLKIFSGELDIGVSGSSIWRQPNIRVGHLTQYAVEEMDQYRDLTVMEYTEKYLKYGRACSSTLAKSAGSGNVRQYLGAFGLGGKHALQPVGKLSGGERMRLCFASVLADEPHIVFFDESTNHVDIQTLESMSAALNEYEGTVMMVSHNQAFLSGFCKELWVLEDGRVTVNHSETESFDEMFSQYRRSILQKGGTTLSDQHRQKARLAKRATKQRAGAKQNTALL